MRYVKSILRRIPNTIYVSNIVRIGHQVCLLLFTKHTTTDLLNINEYESECKLSVYNRSWFNGKRTEWSIVSKLHVIQTPIW